jgi:protein-L-isoaspartate(D-aspartate) O-methyltransferase
MNFELARHNMVVHQLERRGIHDSRVLEAMEWVRREMFVPTPLLTKAYDDCALPIGLEQTISQPYTVAFMCQEARLAPDSKVLEIGTGSGYGAAVLSLLAREVHTIERHEELAANARERLEGWKSSITKTSESTKAMARSACRKKRRSMRSSSRPGPRSCPSTFSSSSSKAGGW